VDNVERQARYGGGTTADVLKLIKDGRENDGLTPGQRRRKRLKRGGTRRAQTPPKPKPREAGPLEAAAAEQPVVVEVYGQRWEIS
jgi:hypothetical protein